MTGIEPIQWFPCGRCGCSLGHHLVFPNGLRMPCHGRLGERCPSACAGYVGDMPPPPAGKPGNSIGNSCRNCGGEIEFDRKDSETGQTFHVVCTCANRHGMNAEHYL